VGQFFKRPEGKVDAQGLSGGTRAADFRSWRGSFDLGRAVESWVVLLIEFSRPEEQRRNNP